MPKRLYLAAAVAFRQGTFEEDGAPIHETFPLMIVAASLSEATAEARRELVRACPPSEGWYGHTAHVSTGPAARKMFEAGASGFQSGALEEASEGGVFGFRFNAREEAFERVDVDVRGGFLM